MKEYTMKVHDDGRREWYLNGKRHREDGPAIVNPNGCEVWYLDGQLHCEDGPAVKHTINKYEEWYLNGKRHRKDGPAVKNEGGFKAWYFNGKLHREDGPAIEFSDNKTEWYLDGVELTKEEFLRRRQDTINGKIAEIDGKKYELKLVE
jgi:hypothetical protein